MLKYEFVFLLFELGILERKTGAQWNLCTNFWLSIKSLPQIILLWIVSVGGFWFMAAVNVTEVLFQYFWLKSRENAKIILGCVLWLSSICSIFSSLTRLKPWGRFLSLRDIFCLEVSAVFVDDVYCIVRTLEGPVTGPWPDRALDSGPCFMLARTKRTLCQSRWCWTLEISSLISA